MPPTPELPLFCEACSCCAACPETGTFFAYQPDTCVKSVVIALSGSSQKLSPRFCVKMISRLSFR